MDADCAARANCTEHLQSPTWRLESNACMSLQRSLLAERIAAPAERRWAKAWQQDQTFIISLGVVAIASTCCHCLNCCSAKQTLLI